MASHWKDANGNGAQNPSENGINGVQVDLFKKNAAGNLVFKASTLTVNDGLGKPGFYIFPALSVGDYVVQVVPPAGTTFTFKNAGLDETVDSDFNQYGFSDVVHLDPDGTAIERNNRTIDAGLVDAASIGDFVWNDLNRNGLQDAGEPGMANVTVTLLRNLGGVFTPYMTVTTDATGHYLFSNIPPDDYKVAFSLPVNYEFTLQNQPDDNLNSDPDQNTGMTGVIIVPQGTINRRIDAGLVFVKVFRSSIGDYVWLDTDHNGIQDPTEPGIAGVTVTLLNGTGQILRATATDAKGKYLFDNLTVGQYQVVVTPPVGLQFTTQTLNTTNGSDVEANEALASYGKMPVITLTTNSSNLDQDAGLYLIYDPAMPNFASVGDFVWNDLNNNGKQDAGEPGIAGVKVELRVGTTTLRTVYTDIFGAYIFNGLSSSTYNVKFTAPSGFAFSPKTAGTNTDKDSNPDATGVTDGFNLVAGQNNLSIDAGLYNATLPTGSIGDYVFYDAYTVNGIQDPQEGGIQGITVTLYAANGTTVLATTSTDLTGHYLFPNLAAGNYVVGFSNNPANLKLTVKGAGSDATKDSDANPATGKTDVIALANGQNRTDIDAGFVSTSAPAGRGSLGNFVWNDLNHDGKQDAGEPGIAGVTVLLLNSSGAAVGPFTTTDAKGYYIFNDLSAGTYIVQFINLPANFSFTTPNALGTTLDNDSNVDGSGFSNAITLADGETNLSVDAGAYNTFAGNYAALGDFVWNDLNHDGIQQPNEPGVGGVTVLLIRSSDNAVVGTQVTDNAGHYLFTEVASDDYIVEFRNLPNGYTFTLPNQGTDNALDSDASFTGVVIDGSSSSTIIHLNPDEINLTIDAGIYSNTKAGLGDYVWFDTNNNGVQDLNEHGVAGATVNLYDSNGIIINESVTDANGFYIFQNLDPAAYQIGVSTLPIGALFTKANFGGDATKDSNVQPATSKSDVVILTGGTYDPTIDCGIFSGRVASLGDFVWNDSKAMERYKPKSRR